jgi:hypothetical protein
MILYDIFTFMMMTMSPDDLLKNVDLTKIATEGSAIYNSVKSSYEPVHTGKFLAIEIESKDQHIGSSSAEALVQARAAHPGKVFYVVKIGFDAAETMANLVVSKN